MNITEIIERLEKATGPDRYLDLQIGATFGTGNEDMDEAVARAVRVYSPDDAAARASSGMSILRTAPYYTTSLDAITGLIERVLPGTYWLVASGKARPDEPLGGAQLYRDGAMISDAEAETAALALALAFARALQKKEPTP